jgi:uroporphyrinogen decarboxylase
VTGRERVWKALNNEPGDRPPRGELLFTREFVRNSGCMNLWELVFQLDQDLVTLPLDGTGPSAWATWKTRVLFPMGCLSGPLSQLMETLGWRGMALLVVKERDQAVRIMESYLDGWADRIIKACDMGCEGVVLADDIAGGRGLLVSPDFLKTCYFPLLSRFIKAPQFKGLPFIFHSDGNLREMIPQVRGAGFSGIHGLQPSVGIAPEAFDAMGMGKFVFWGNFEFEGDGRLKDVLEVKKEVKTLLKRWERFPGYIFGSSGGIYGALDYRTVKQAHASVGPYYSRESRYQFECKDP